MWVGGGSGHYPAFAGYVGPGLADRGGRRRCLCLALDGRGSPRLPPCRPGRRLYCSASATMAGDVLNFGVAAERLRSEGIDVRILPVTDDVASAPAETSAKRRGIAGDLVVFKIAGAAAEAGKSLDEVERLARSRHERTVSFGVAFGAARFRAPPVRFHRAKGRWRSDSAFTGNRASAKRRSRRRAILAKLLTGSFLPRRPAGSRKVRQCCTVSARPSMKNFSCFGRRSPDSSAMRARNRDPECGEFVTSLGHEGCSLTLLWLDDEELEALWRAPTDAPVLRKGVIIAAEPATDEIVDADGPQSFGPAAEASKESGKCIAG